MYNALVFAPTFLKSSCAVGQIERNLFSHLSDHKLHVLCSENSDLDENHENILTYKSKESSLVNTLNLIFRRLKFSDLYHSPDSYYYSWGIGAYCTARKILRQQRIDYILSINNPVSTHLLANKIKKKFNVPWIAYLFDPWHNNPYRQYKTTFFNRLDAKNEQLVATNADLILFPNKELLDSWIETYGDLVRNKAAVLPFPVPEIKTIDCTSTNDKIIISHIGTLSKERRPVVFFEALKRLRETAPTLFEKLHVNIVGHITETDRELINKDNLSSIITVTGHISEHECVQYYESSDLFLIIDIDCHPNLFYPSKLLKYFRYQKPIIGITTDNSVVANELKKTHNHIFKYNDYESLCSFLAKIIQKPSLACTNDTDYYKLFEVNKITSEYLEHIKKIIQ